MQERTSMCHSGLLVVRRVNWFTEFSRANRLPAMNLSHEKILVVYRGFDGQPWPDAPNTELPRLEGGLAPLDQYNDVEAFYNAASNEYLCDLIYIQFSNRAYSLSSSPPDLVFLGYDYGY